MYQNNTFNSLLESHGLTHEALTHIVDQGVQLERLNLEILGSASPHIRYESECRILQGEILLSLLRVASLRA